MIIGTVIIIVWDLRRLRPLEWIICQSFDDAYLFLNWNYNDLLSVVLEGKRGSCQNDTCKYRSSELKLSLLDGLALYIESRISYEITTVVIWINALYWSVGDKKHLTDSQIAKIWINCEAAAIRIFLPEGSRPISRIDRGNDIH